MSDLKIGMILLTACTLSHRDLPQGGNGGDCYPNGTCDTGLSCQEALCFPPPDGGDRLHDPDAGARDGGSADGSTAYHCNDDAAYEPNNSLDTAFHVGTPTNLMLDNLAICPNGDLDYYAIDLTQQTITSVDVLVTFDDPSHGGVPLVMSLLNSNGVPIVNATKVGDMLHVHTSQLPFDVYYIYVRSAGGVDNYTMNVNVTQ